MIFKKGMKRRIASGELATTIDVQGQYLGLVSPSHNEVFGRLKDTDV